MIQNLNQVVYHNLIHFHIHNIYQVAPNRSRYLKQQELIKINNHLNYQILIRNLNHVLLLVLLKLIF